MVDGLFRGLLPALFGLSALLLSISSAYAMSSRGNGTVVSSAQEESSPDCGTLLSPEGARRSLELDSLGAYRLDGSRPRGAGPWHVRTAIHIVRTDEGEGGLSEVALAASLQRANEHFAPLQIVFHPVGETDYIDSDAFYYEINTLAEIDQLRSTNPVEHALNIYFTENLANENGSFCGISSFSWSRVQGVVLMNACVPSSWNPSTFSHELGHYFDLVHTHETAYGWECVDGSNCATAGDRLCDTPADPGLLRCGSGGNEYCVNAYCLYIGGFTDPCHGDLYHPLTDNLMSASRPPCRTGFTPDQREKAEATLLNIRSDHILDPAGIASDSEDRVRPDLSFLGAPAPNPSHGRVTCSLHTTAGADAGVRLFDAAGRAVQNLMNQALPPGPHTFTWDLDGRLPGGIYFLRADLGGTVRTRVIVLSR